MFAAVHESPHGAMRTLGKIPTPSGPCGLAYRPCGSTLKYDFAANDRYVGLDVLDLILGHGHVICRENHYQFAEKALVRACG